MKVKLMLAGVALFTAVAAKSPSEIKIVTRSPKVLQPGQSAHFSLVAVSGAPRPGWTVTWDDGLFGSRRGAFAFAKGDAYRAGNVTYAPAACTTLGAGDHVIPITATVTDTKRKITRFAALKLTLRCAPLASSVGVKIIAINDVHGQISAGKKVSDRPAGSAAVITAYLKSAMAGKESSTVVVEAGDLIGASPASSALLQDEPTVAFFNALANASCHSMPPPKSQSAGVGRFDDLFDPLCNLVGVPGNHELDEGTDELFRVLGGGNHSHGPFLADPWRGARFPVISANIRRSDGAFLFRPYAVKVVNNAPIAFIGATFSDTPSIVTPTGVSGLVFSNEAEAVNAQVKVLQAQGIHAFVVVVHAGGTGQAAYLGPTDPKSSGLSTEITNLVAQLDADVDVVITAHSHAFANALLKNAGGRDVLVTQAYSAGTAYADIDLTIDASTLDINLSKTAHIVTTYADEGPGLSPDPEIKKLTDDADARVAPIANAIVATTAAASKRGQTAAGESSLGDLIAETHRVSMKADFGITNSGGLRADLPVTCTGTPCNVTWNDCFTTQPFANQVVAVTLTGQQLADVLEQQWVGQVAPKMLQISGFTYSWSASAAAGAKMVPGSLKKADGTPIDKASSYVVALNSFLADGGDGFTGFKAGRNRSPGPIDLDALVVYLKAQTQPLAARPTDGRIQTVP